MARRRQTAIAIDGHEDRHRVGCVAFEPGTRNIAIGDSEGFVRHIGADGALRTLGCCDDAVCGLAFTRDGALLASQALGEPPRLWRRAQGWASDTLRTRLQAGQTIAFSHDAKIVYVVDERGRLRALPVAGGPLRTLIDNDRFEVAALAVSPRRGALAVASARSEIRIVDAEGKTLRAIEPGAHALAFSPDARLLAAAHEDGTVTIRRAATLEPLHVLRTTDLTAFDLRFSPDGVTLAVGDASGVLRLWSVESARLRRTLDDHSGWVLSLDFSSDGELLAAGGPDQCMTLWNARSGRRLAAVRLIGAADWLVVAANGACDFSATLEPNLYCVAGDRPFEFSGYRDARRAAGLLGQLLSAAREPRARAKVLPKLTPLASHAEEARPAVVALTLRNKPTNKIRCLAFSPDGRLLASGGRDMNIDLWNVETCSELRTLRGHNGTVTSVTFSADGPWIASGACDGTVRLWDLASGRCLFERGVGARGAIVCAKLLSDRGLLVAAANDGTVKYWECATGRLLHVLRLYEFDYARCVLSDDGRMLAQLHERGSVTVWDLELGRSVCRMRHWRDDPGSLAFSRDGRKLFVGAATTRQTIIIGASSGARESRPEPFPIDICDLASGQRTRLDGHTGNVMALAVDPGGSILASGADDGTVRLWDLNSGREMLQARTVAHFARALAFSPDSRLLAAGEAREPFHGRVELWNAQSLEPVATFKRNIGDVYAVAFSADGKSLFTAGEDPRVACWRLNESGGPRHLAESPHPDESLRVTAFGLTRDASLIAAGSGDGVVRVWHAADGQLRAALSNGVKHINGVALSADGSLAAAGGKDGNVWVWSVNSRGLLRMLDAGEADVFCLAWSSAGSLAAGSFNGAIQVWNPLTGRRLRRWETAGGPIYHLAFSPDGQWLASGHWDQSIRIQETRSTSGPRMLEGHSVPGTIEKGTSTAFNPDGMLLASTGADATLRLWDTRSWICLSTRVAHTGSCACVRFDPTGTLLAVCGNDAATTLWDVRDPTAPRQLVTLYSFPDNSWAVLDLAGRYDASDGGDIAWLHWVVGLEPLELSQLKDRYYEPGLLPKCVGFAVEAVRPVPPLADLPLYPSIEIAPAADGASAQVRLVDRGGGIGRVVVSINGKEVDADARGAHASAAARSLTIEVNVAGRPLVLPGKLNRIDIRAYNADGFLVSRPSGWNYEAPRAVRAAPQLWAVIVGTALYANPKLNLHFPGHDARSMATAVQLAGERLLGAENVHMYVLASSVAAPDAAPLRARVIEALQSVAHAAKSEDILVIYLAGHGVSRGEGDYYYLTADAHTLSLEDPAVRAATTLSSTELTERIGSIAALKQVLVLDTCAAGGAVERLAGRSVPSSQVRALERLKDRTGLYILAGAAIDALAYESSVYGQGLLTYSLLSGMRGAKLREDRFVSVPDLFSFAADLVPTLAGSLGAIQRPLLASPRAADPFDIGQLDPEDRASIPLASVRPVVVRSAFTDELEIFDTLGLARQVNEALRTQAARGADAPLAFIDVAVGEFPDAYALAGRYSSDHNGVNVKTRLRRGATTIADFVVSGAASSIANQLVASLLDELTRSISRLQSA